MTAEMAKRISTVRILIILLLGCAAFSVFLDMKVVSSSHNNQMIHVRVIREPSVRSRRTTILKTPKNETSPKDGHALQKIPQNEVQTSTTDVSKKNLAEKNATPSSDPLHPDTARALTRPSPNDTAPIEVLPSKQSQQQVPVQEQQLEMPDDPEAYMKSHKETMKRKMSKQEEKEKEDIRLEQKKHQDIFPKLFWMFNQLNLPDKNKPKNRTKLVFDLSANAKKSGKIGPFTETKRINKALKSISETGHKEEMTQSAQVAVISLSGDSNDSIGEGAPFQNKVLSTTSATVDIPKLTTSADKEAPQSESGKSPPTFAATKKAISKNISEPNVVPKPKPVKPGGVSHDIDHNELSLNESEIEELKNKVEELNRNQTISNVHLYGPVENNTLIILIQVHSRIHHLGQLISSLSKAKYINECLVVFSHDFWQPEINQLVESIEAFRVMQIFFPFSVQLHPHSFPGSDPRDCHWNHVTRESQKHFKHSKVCLNEAWSDTYGHYREPRFTQIKHHWWWKTHKVFDNLTVTSNFTGDVLFLEDDQFVAPDTIHTLRLLRTIADERNAHVLSVGNFVASTPSIDTNQVFLGDWGGTKYNLGFAFNSKTWNMIKSQADFFCTFDDYNWDWTLASLLSKNLALKNAMLAVRLSRVYHIGPSCGTHAKPNTSCNLNEALKDANRKLTMAKPYLFPSSLQLTSSQNNLVKQKRNNGGWGDLRDKQLCAAVSNGTASEDTLAALQFPEFML